jgi:precorrin-2/cobalt-factor-2 C20-methyltransferase
MTMSDDSEPNDPGASSPGSAWPGQKAADAQAVPDPIPVDTPEARLKEEILGNARGRTIENRGGGAKGCLYGVSLGPGDPGLITRWAWELLNSEGLWTYPVRKPGGDSFALDIARRAGLVVPDSALPLCFPMTHNPEILAKHWLAAAATVLEPLVAGRDVFFLVEGDASTYSTFGHLARTVAALDAGIHVEVVAGVTSYQAAAAHLGLALADADDTLAILPAGYGVHTIDHLLDEFDSLVLLKVKPLLDDIIDLLARRGLLQHARFVEKVGCPEERTVRDLTQIRGETVNYLSLLLVHNPNRPKGEMLRGCRKPTPGVRTDP